MKYSLKDFDMPEKLKEFTADELDLLSYEIRDLLLENVSKTGGHLASNLGVVELTIALHTVFDSPTDKIIWDVGHQSYVHKILTGRADKLHTLRTYGGISGFTKTGESCHDMYDSGHSSTSISAALGYAAARDLDGEDYSVVAVIGDGALTGGVAYEALNNAGNAKSSMLVILNDNEMSISENVGGITHHLGRLRASSTYLDFKRALKKTLTGIPKVGHSIYSGFEHIRDTVKYAVIPGAIFEELGFKYFGPVDGHNIRELLEAMELTKSMEGPVLLHVVTKKGKGYRNAENEPGKFHGITPFDTTTGSPLQSATGQSYSQVFGKKMMALARKDPRLVVVSAAMLDGTGLSEFSVKFPERTFDVGIAEQHAVSFAAGLALNGYRPVVALYSTFLQRAYDEVLIDVCLQNLPVVFAIDRAGNVGADGETHNGQFDLSFLSHMPNLTLLAPKDGEELEAMLDYAMTLSGPCAIRYPRGDASSLLSGGTDRETLRQGKLELLKQGTDVCLLAAGRMTKNAMEAAAILEKSGISASVANARFIKPLDQKGILELVRTTDYLVTLEDNTTSGGFGSAVAGLLGDAELRQVSLLNIGWPDRFIPQGSTEKLMREYRMDAFGIAERVAEFIERKA